MQSGDFLLSARVTVDFAGTYDAGVLVLYESDGVWAKLCFEYSPQREPMVVSVVTRGVSDDCNSFVVDGASVWLRIARVGSGVRLPCVDRRRKLELHPPLRAPSGREPSVGFAAQSPTGEACAVAFEDISYEAARLDDLRSGV